MLVIIEKALKMEKAVLDCYQNDDMDAVTKLDVIVNYVEEYVAEYMQAVICHLQDVSKRH